MLFLGLESTQAGIDDGLVAHFAFNGNVADTAGTNVAEIFGSVAFSNAINGQALSLSAEGDYVQIQPSSDIAFSNDFKTISVWFNAGTQGNSQNAIFDKTANSDYDLDLLTNADPNVLTIRFRARDGSTYQSISGNVSPGQWINAVVVKTGTNVSFYTNAQLVGTMVVESVLTKSNALIVGAGGSPYLSGYNFNGLIEDLRFYDRALSADEIQSLYFWSYPTLSISMGALPGESVISWNSINERFYQPQYVSDLNGESWNNFGSPVMATNGIMSLTDTNSGTSSQRFYRVILQ